MAERPRAPVVVTRPLAQAQALQQRLAASGREAIVFPLLEIHPLADFTALDAALAQLERHALVAFVSPNAIDAAFARRPNWPASVPLAVMGEGSRQALAAHGVTSATTRIYSPLDVNRTDSQTLLAALDLPTLVHRSVLILRGESGRELLADALVAADVQVTQVAAYRRAAPAFDAAGAARLRQLLGAGCDWIITSSEALQILLRMAAQADGMQSMPAQRNSVVELKQQRLIVPHARIAERAQELGFCRVIRTGSGDEGVLAALQFLDD